MKLNKKKNSDNGHVWRFFRAGGFDQVQLDSGADLKSLDTLDQKLWVALACPTDNVFFDTRTLSLIDTDGDRRVRAVELLAAIKWTITLLKNPDDLVASKETLSIQAIDDTNDEGKKIITAARNVILAIGKKESDEISVLDTESLEKVLSQRIYNGDGIITEDTVGDENEIKDVLLDIISVLGGVTDRSGKLGVNTEMVENYFSLSKSYEKWFTESENDSDIFPCGESTPEAAQAVLDVRDKINDYFSRCAIADFDERSINYLNGGEKEFSELGSRVISEKCSEIEALPIARINPQAPLSLTKEINPFWINKIKKFQELAVNPIFGLKNSLTETEWQELLSRFLPYFKWIEQKPTVLFDKYKIDKLRNILNGATYEKLMTLIESDKAEAPIFDALIDLEKLVRFHRDLYRLCTNFINFKDFYSKGGPAMFQAGTLYLDQRSCNLCIKIDDYSKHSMLAAMAGTYLVYCECKRHAGNEKQYIVAAFTNGDSENLIVGRNGVFYDRAGNDWDASIVKIIENPISIKQSFWLPYKSLVRMIESQVAKRAMAADAQSNTKLSQAATLAVNADRSTPDQLPSPPKKFDVGVVAALGVAAGALGTFVATIFGYIAGIIRLGPLAVIGALLGLLALVSGPSIILAYIKLRKRNLGPILDAGGWAINAKARINVPFGTVLTQIANLPAGSQRNLTDPYAEKKSPWPKVISCAIVIYLSYVALDHLGFINEWTNGRVGIRKEHLEKVMVIKKNESQPILPASQH